MPFLGQDTSAALQYFNIMLFCHTFYFNLGNELFPFSVKFCLNFTANHFLKRVAVPWIPN